jgi:trehalose synthase
MAPRRAGATIDAMPLTDVPIAPLSPDRFEAILDTAQEAHLERTIAGIRAGFEQRVLWNVNSTARGGGVAEMLSSLLAYARGIGVDARWVVIDGDPEFFAVTKRIHNMLHGSAGDGHGLTDADDALYRATAAARAEELAPLVRPDDIVLLHDPQTAGLIDPIRARGAHVVWRCHVGIDTPNDFARAAWEFLLPHVRLADAIVFSRDAFIWEGLDPARVTVIKPSIDAFSAKNQDLSPAQVDAILRATCIAADGRDGEATFARHDGTPGRVDRCTESIASLPLPAEVPAIVQVSRWDRLKDPLGVLEAYCRHVVPHDDAHLVLAGPAAGTVADDPEAESTLSEVARRAAECPPEVRARIHLFALPMDDLEENAAIVNALQRRATVVVQKSMAEGFGLTVAEAMWKARPVVASDVGGIREQVVHGESGVLVDPRDGEAFGAAVVELLGDPERRAALGTRARAHVRSEFLGPRHAGDYLALFERLLGTAADAPVPERVPG